MSTPQRFNLVVVGDINAGKTSILERYTHGTFSDCTPVDIGELL